MKKHRSKYHQPYDPVVVVVREAEGSGREFMRDLFRGDARRVERRGPDDEGHSSKLSKRPLVARIDQRRRKNQIAKASRQANR